MHEHPGQLTYVSLGYLRGVCPNGRVATVRHLKAGRTGYELLWEGRWQRRFGQANLARVFGISPRSKRSGSQEGYPAEPVIRALWRHLTDRFNRGDEGVTYSAMPSGLL